MKNYGIKVSRPGFDVLTSQPNELAFSSGYKTLKVHTSGSGILTDSSRTATIPHNLGYVPLFVLHTTTDAWFGDDTFSSTDYLLSPAGFGGLMADPLTGVQDDLFAYADNTNLYIKAQNNFSRRAFKISNTSNLDECYAYEYTGFEGGTGTGEAWIGHDTTLENEYGAVRFGNILLNQGESIYNATFNLYVNGRDGTSEVKMTIWGINEDNTQNFNTGTVATARGKTTASVNSNSTLSLGDSLGVNVTSIVQEIVNRAGWSKGNALGIMFWNNGTIGDNAYFSSSTTHTYLSILKSSTLAHYKYTIFKNQLE